MNLRSPKLWARLFAFLLALESVGILTANLLMVRVPFLLADERDTLADRARFAVDAYMRLSADLFQISPREMWVRVAVSATFAIAGLIAAWLAWRLRAWGRGAILFVVGGRAIAYVVFWAVAGFGWSVIDWDEIVWYVAVIGVFLSPPVARLYKRAPGRPSG